MMAERHSGTVKQVEGKSCHVWLIVIAGRRRREGRLWWRHVTHRYYSFYNQRFLSEFDRAHPLSVRTSPKFNNI
jgi:hypothetical protein